MKLQLVEGDWKIDQFSDYAGAEVVPCVPNDVTDELVDTAVAWRQARLESVSLESAPEHSLAALRPLAVPGAEFPEYEEFNQFYRDAGEHVEVDVNLGTLMEEAVPGEAYVTVCESADRFDAVDTATGDVLEDVSLDGLFVVELHLIYSQRSWLAAGEAAIDDTSVCAGVQLEHNRV